MNVFLCIYLSLFFISGPEATGCEKVIKIYVIMENLNNLEPNGSIANLVNQHKAVKVYEDALESKGDITKDFRGKTGVYMWFNKITGKVYVGSGVDLSRRLSCYYQPSILKKPSLIHQNLIKYGHSNFSLAILEVCGDSKDVPKKEYIAREQFFLDWALKSYGLGVLNILPLADSSFGYKHREETLSKMRDIKLGEKNPMYGKSKSDAFIFHQKRDKFGANNPQFGVKKTKETIAKLTKKV